jgi:hypothetical protein
MPPIIFTIVYKALNYKALEYLTLSSVLSPALVSSIEVNYCILPWLLQMNPKASFAALPYPSRSPTYMPCTPIFRCGASISFSYIYHFSKLYHGFVTFTAFESWIVCVAEAVEIFGE